MVMQEAYKNREKEINDVVDFIFSQNSQILLYESLKGLGNTAFISRIIYILQKTPTVQLFSAELSLNEKNPIHAIVNRLSSKSNKLYQQLQMFTDEEYGTFEVPFLSSIIKDISKSDTLAALFQPKAALPIYTGFYPSRLKEVFFRLADEITKDKVIVIFIDNIQYMDNESIYELKALLNNPKIKIVCIKSDLGENFEKFYLETKHKYNYTQLSFPLPDVSYVKKLAEIYHKTISDEEADMVLFKSNGNIRKILFHLGEPLQTKPIDSVKLQILKIIYLYNDFITSQILLKILEVSPYKKVLSSESIPIILNTLEKEGFLKPLIDFDGKSKSYRIDSVYTLQIDIADRLIISKSLLAYYGQNEDLSYQHLLQAWQFATLLNDQRRSQQFAVSIVKKALQMGYPVDKNIISTVQAIGDNQIQLLVAVFFFCNAKYKQAKVILDTFVSDDTSHAINVIYAITLNRCREHQLAKEKLLALIHTSDNIDELALLVSFLISNYVHSGSLKDAINVYQTFNEQIKYSKKYPYFLRNVATIFEPSMAGQLRNKAKCIFEKNGDLFGYYSTIINLTAYNLKNVSISYALNQALMAFEGLQQFGASQIHLAANNLGVCYLMSNNYIEAIKYLTLSIESAKTIMPIGYATFNLAAMYIKIGEVQIARELVTNLKQQVLSSGLPRLKGKYNLSMAVIEYVCGNYETSQKFSHLAIMESNFALGTKPYEVVAFLEEKCSKSSTYKAEQWDDLYAPCFLEYWTISSVDILADELLTF